MDIMKILIAEDLEDNREMLKTMLTGSGYDVKACKNGKEALELLHNEEFDLIISDILMPVMDGYLLCRECMKDKNIAHIPFVFYSATYVSEEDEKFAYSIGVERFIRKPKEPEEFIKIIKKVISDNKLLGPKSSKPQVESEEEIMKLYNQRLINKLEKKMLDLEKSQEFFKSVFESASDTIVIADSEGKILDINNAGLTLFGYSRDEIIGQHMSLLAPEDLHIEQQEFIKKVKETKSIRNFITYRKGKDKRLFPVEMSATIMHNKVGDELGFISIIRDITERKRAEGEITRLYKAISQTPTPIALTDLDGYFIYVNPRICELSGYSKEELIGNHSRILKSGKHAPEFYKNLWDTITSGKTWKGEFINKKKNGELYLIDANIAPVINEQGIITHYIKVSKDITAQRKMQDDLVLAKKKAEESNRLKTAFLNNMSHEIRTPMNGILGFAQLLKEPNLTFGEQQKFLGFMEKSGERMLNIISAIVSISKIESGQMEVSVSKTDVNKQIEKIHSAFKPEVDRKGIQFSVNAALSSTESIINTDSEKLFSIMTNLVGNAVKFTHSGSIEFGYKKKGENLEFFVKDTGDGIADEKKEIIFIRFRQGSESNTRAYEGAGLGLSISKAYVEMLGGKIWVESELGKGSIFYFTLPYNAEPEAKIVTEEIVSADKEEIQNKKLKILIVEDDEASEQFLSLAVGTFDKDVFKARNGIEAIEVCRNNPGIDLVLMDIRMPDMDGYEATRKIRQFNKKVVIIAQTAFGLSGDREKAIKAGCNDYIAKPINKDELQVLIQKYFGG